MLQIPKTISAKNWKQAKEVLPLVKRSIEMATQYAYQEPEMIYGRFLPPSEPSEAYFKPWPQPSPRFPGRDAATVLHFSETERRDFAAHILSRYAKQICTDWVSALQEAFDQEGLDAVSDFEFSEFFENSILTQFITPLDSSDPFFSKTKIQPHDLQTFYQADFSAVELLKPLKDCYIAPSIAYFSKKSNEALVPEGILINGLYIKPENTNAWDLAKYFVLQAGTITMVLLSHPRVHFPMDAINAITKTILPPQHLIYQLFHPHMWLTLPLNRRVQWSPHSIVTNDQELIYSPFPSTTDSNFLFKSASMVGFNENSTYPAYAFPTHPDFSGFPSDYKNGLKKYFEAILEFCTLVAKKVFHSDPLVSVWANEISHFVPGFPDAQEITRGDTLARTLAFYVYDVSVLHAVEHELFSRLPIRKAALKLRVPPPAQLEIPKLNRKKLVEPLDIFRQSMAHKMFFKPNNLTLLKDVRYGFEKDEALKKHVEEFKQNLRKVDSDLAHTSFPRLDFISASIQY